MKRTEKVARATPTGAEPETATPAEPSTGVESPGSVMGREDVIIAPRLSYDECAAIIAAYTDGATSLGSVVHKLHLFGFRA